ncbi:MULTISPECIES: 1-phosphofructokinase family hexose kinase [Streptomyces]|uniref:1-phosphofructokinase family hexose kinase n=2 Tax=Streptomyces TaxID=1883 RepID=A0A5P2DRM0_STRVZ|nr:MULTISPECIES: 1-phosphofructokinase family hexose kinase [Streptomyces]QES57852.1 1-phosphofructokinase family hexose kinase [Streptomyces venezuelae]QNE29127.1 1-phosphofructokinase family hexose kinase [Streptomyces sp. INR7]RST03249.1 1-phosphofructokinase family hexose kinase [Streptomyces sp. WAC05950]
MGRRGLQGTAMSTAATPSPSTAETTDGAGGSGSASGPSILTLTMNPAIDLCWEVDRLEGIGKNRARVRSVAVGGGGINVARHVVRLGGRATAFHTAGGEVGLRLNRLLDEEGIDHVAVDIDDETREALVLFETQSHRSFHIVPPGPRLHRREGERCLDVLERFVAGSPSYVVASGSLPAGLPDDFYATVARRVRRAGSRLILDTSGPALPAALAEGVFLFRCNRTEAESLTGHPVSGFDDARSLNERLLTTGAAEIAVTTLGALGALCSTAHGHTELHAPPLPGEPLSDAGAGDSMVAALTTRLAAGEDPVSACALGVATAAAAMLTPSTEPFDAEVARSLRSQVRTARRG